MGHVPDSVPGEQLFLVRAGTFSCSSVCLISSKKRSCWLGSLGCFSHPRSALTQSLSIRKAERSGAIWVPESSGKSGFSLGIWEVVKGTFGLL